jgi:uncharacterized protein (TIRG00374 family)
VSIDLPAATSWWRPWARRALSVIAFAVFAYLFWPLLGEVRDAAHLFATAHWAWLPVVLLLQGVSYASLTWLNQLALRPFPGRIGFARLAATLTSMAFIEVAIPSAGISGVVLRARLLGRNGYAAEASTFTLVIETAFLGAAMSAVAGFGLAFLVQRGELTQAMIFRLAGVAAGVLALGLASWHVLRSEPRTRGLLLAAIRIWNRSLGKRRPLGSEPMLARLTSFHLNLAAYRRVPLAEFLAAAGGRVFLDVASLGACFLLFGGRIGWGTLLTGYGLILLLSGVAALPGGLGLADLSVPVVFARLGAPGPVALAGGLTYRLIAFWLLRLIGFAAWQIEEARR